VSRRKPPPIKSAAALAKFAAEHDLAYGVADLERLSLLHGPRTEQHLTDIAALLRLARHLHRYWTITEQQIESLLRRHGNDYSAAAATLEEPWWNRDLGVSPEQVVQACDGRLVADGAVSAAMVVVPEPAVKGCGALCT
jgi:hypothetical protein